MYWKKLILSCTAGNILELYSFILFGYFSQVIGKLFFPSVDEYSSLMLTFCIFATGCLMRPLGSILFGYLGDKLGRKKMLIASIAMITLSTTLIGCLPTYNQVGIIAPFLLIFCRLVQGLSMSGEEVGAAIFLSEILPQNKQGLAGSIILGSVYVGLLFGSVVALLTVSFISQEQLFLWGWRVPFLLSACFGVVSVFLRMQQIESIEFSRAKAENFLIKNPIFHTLFYHKKNLLNGIFACATLAVSVYLFALYIPSCLNLIFGFQTTMFISAASFFVASIFVVIVGTWVDKIGSTYPMLLSCFGFIIFSYPIFFLLSQKTLVAFILAEFILIVCLSLSAGSLMPILIKSFPVNIRFSGVGLSFNLSMTLFGSTTPMLALYLTQKTANPNMPFVCLVGASVLTLFSVMYAKRTIPFSAFFKSRVFQGG